MVLGMVFIHRSAVHQDNQKEEKGCREAEEEIWGKEEADGIF